MGEAKRRRLAAEAAAQGHKKSDIKLMSDIPLALPGHMGNKPEIDVEFQRTLFSFAGETRREALYKLNAYLAEEPDRLVNILLGCIQQVHSKNDLITDSLVTRGDGSEQYKVDCKKGCAWCCFQNVEVTIPEAILVAIDIGAPDDSRQTATLAAADFFFGLDAFARTKTGKACPFLIENVCSVYANRPINCRSFLSPNADACREGLQSIVEGRPAVTVQSHGTPQLFGRALQASIQGLCKDLGLQHDLVDLTQAVASILRDPTIIDQWAVGDHAFSPLAIDNGKILDSFL